jgi:hypothetical protein
MLERKTQDDSCIACINVSCRIAPVIIQEQLPNPAIGVESNRCCVTQYGGAGDHVEVECLAPTTSRQALTRRHGIASVNFDDNQIGVTAAADRTHKPWLHNVEVVRRELMAAGTAQPAPGQL